MLQNNSYIMSSIYYGIILDVWPVNHKNNLSKQQTEYNVKISLHNASEVTCRCIAANIGGGSLISLQEEQLLVNSKVLVQFPNGLFSIGIITHTLRSFYEPSDKKLLFRKSFKLLDILITTDGEYKIIQKDNFKNPNALFLMSQSNIKLGVNMHLSALENSITIDKNTNSIIIKSGKWNVEVKSMASININGNANINIKGNASITAQAGVSVNTKGTAKIDAMNANITAKSKAVIKAQNIELNNATGNIITTATQPTCYVTGIPFKGVPTIKAG